MHMAKVRRDAARMGYRLSVRTGSSASAQASQQPDEFEPFEGLARKLVNLPKAELDEARKQKDG
jgi:hypothetical protein